MRHRRGCRSRINKFILLWGNRLLVQEHVSFSVHLNLLEREFSIPEDLLIFCDSMLEDGLPIPWSLWLDISRHEPKTIAPLEQKSGSSKHVPVRCFRLDPQKGKSGTIYGLCR